MRRKRRGRPVGEYFLAAVGIALIALVVLLVASSGSCRFRMSPELTEPPGPTRPAPTAPR